MQKSYILYLLTFFCVTCVDYAEYVICPLAVAIKYTFKPYVYLPYDEGVLLARQPAIIRTRRLVTRKCR